jgi:Holliday junction resolvasome RuvABC endonuclease subunit
MTTLALDLATVTGHALMASGVLTSGSRSFRQVKTRHPAHHAGDVFLEFQRWIRERILEDKPEVIVYEDIYRWMSADAAKLFCGMRAVLLMNAAYHEIQVLPYSPPAIKKFWTGSGVAKKDVMIAHTLARFPELREKKPDDNECDAIALLHLHLACLPPIRGAEMPAHT